MSIYTNGTRFMFYDRDLQCYPVFCTLQCKIVAVCRMNIDAMEVVDVGLLNFQRAHAERQKPTTLRAKVVNPALKQIENEFRRRAGMKYPVAFLY